MVMTVGKVMTFSRFNYTHQARKNTQNLKLTDNFYFTTQLFFEADSRFCVELLEFLRQRKVSNVMAVGREITYLIYVKITQFKGSEYRFTFLNNLYDAQCKPFRSMQEFPLDLEQLQQLQQKINIQARNIHT